MDDVQEFLDNLAGSLKLMREESGLSQKKLARLLKVDQSFISRIEKKGQTDISVANAFRIGAALGMDLEFEFTDPEAI